MKFVIYSRKSVYTGRGESIENQIEMCRDYILSNYPGSAAEDITVYEDEGFSGKDLDRPQFRTMMRDMERTRPDCLVCYRLDRISRNVGDFAALIERLNDRGIAFVCIRERFDTGTPMGKAMLYIASVFAQLERETIAERVRDNMLMLARTGRWLGGTTPTGFTSEKTREVVIDGRVKSSCRLRTDPEEIAIVDAIYQKFLEVQSLNGVCRYLHERGIRSRTGQEFSLIGLREILRNPVYCIADRDALDYFTRRRADVCFNGTECGRHGLLAYNKRDYTHGRAPRNPVEKWIVAEGKHAGRVSGRDWVAVQEILDRNRPDADASNARNGYALLSGLVFCAGCGRRMFSKGRSGRAGQYDYICQSKLRLGKTACSSQNLQGELADELVFRRLKACALPKEALLRQLEQLARELPVRRREGEGEAVRRRAGACRRELDQLVRVLETGEPEGEFVRRVAARAAALEEELRRLERAQEETEMDGKQPLPALCMTLADLPDSLEHMSLPEKRALVRLLVQRCEWDGEDLHLYLYWE